MQRAWTTVEEATEIYSRLPNEAKRLKALKEQFFICYLGLGWNEAHHPWSSGFTTYYSSEHLFNHLIKKVIPLATKCEVPKEPLLTLPAPPNFPQLGEKSVIAETLQGGQFQNVIQFKERAHSIRDEREKEGRGDQWSEQQRTLMPEVDSTLIGFHIEILFSFTEPDGTSYLDWCHGLVVAITSELARKVKIKWDVECL